MKHHPIRIARIAVPLTAIAVLAAACSSGSTPSATTASSSTTSGASGTLNGSGSSFQLSYQQQAIQTYRSINPKLTINYGGGGSGKGQTDLASGVVNYAGSDLPIPAASQSKFSGTVLYFPVVIGPITVSYNLSGVKNLKLDGTTTAKIFSGAITTWNDPAIKALNPSETLPSTPITIARRADSSGTTDNFSQFLAKSAGTAWTLGTGSTINFPATSRGGNGNGGVAQIVASTPGSIGYVDYADAKAASLTFASIKNQDGNFIAPSTASATAAASNATINPDLTFSAIWAPGAQSYPITYQSWVLVYKTQSSASTASTLKTWVGYLVGAGQKLLPGLNYAPLPPSLQSKAEAQLSQIGS